MSNPQQNQAQGWAAMYYDQSSGEGENRNKRDRKLRTKYKLQERKGTRWGLAVVGYNIHGEWMWRKVLFLGPWAGLRDGWGSADPALPKSFIKKESLTPVSEKLRESRLPNVQEQLKALPPSTEHRQGCSLRAMWCEMVALDHSCLCMWEEVL